MSKRNLASAAAVVVLSCGPTLDPAPTEGAETSSSSPPAVTTSGVGDSGGRETEPNEATESGAGSSSTTTGTQPSPLVCDDPVPILQSGVEGDVPTGFVRCSNGMIHRVEQVECLTPTPSEGGCSSPDERDCSVDEHCSRSPFGACRVDIFGLVDTCECVYGCATDADCSAGEICVCAGDSPGYPSWTHCVPSSCALGDECDTLVCGLAESLGCGYFYEGGCKSDSDPCVSDADCDGSAVCHPDEGGWACMGPATCG